jgi:putative OPT family oligopeptide transporter
MTALSTGPELPLTQPREMSARSVFAGAAIGILLTLINVYMGLKTGWWETGNITASLLGFALCAGRWRRQSSYSPGENNLTQTIASSMGAMPSTAGLLGAIPALALIGYGWPGWAIPAWGIALGLFGAALAMILRQRLIVQERLPFPTGVATAELIAAMHKSGSGALKRARALGVSLLSAMVFVWFRDGRPAVIPSVTYFPGAARGIPLSSLTLGMAWSPLLLAIGSIMDLRTGLSFALGSLVAWGAVAPVLVDHHLVADADYASLAGWLAWPGVGLVLGGSLISLIDQRNAFSRVFETLRGAGVSNVGRRVSLASLGTLGLLGAGCALIFVVGKVGFDLPVSLIALALVLAFVLCTVCARCAGETDISPLGQAGQLAQVIGGLSLPGQPAANIMAGSVAAGSAAQTSTLLSSLRTGVSLGTSPQRQLLGQLLGIVAGAAVMMPIYSLLVSVHGLGTESLPAPFALQWKALSEVAARGRSALPPYAGSAACAGLVVSIGFALVRKRRIGRFLPSEMLLGIGFIAPANYGIAACVGAILVVLARKWRPSAVDELAPSTAAGAIAGESVIGVVIALLTAIGLLKG